MRLRFHSDCVVALVARACFITNLVPSPYPCFQGLFAVLVFRERNRVASGGEQRAQRIQAGVSIFPMWGFQISGPAI